MITEEDLTAARACAEKYLADDSGGHDPTHIDRVVKNAETIMAREKSSADRNLVILCCLLHDIDDRKINDVDDESRLKKFCAERGWIEAIYNAVKSVISRVSYTDNPDYDKDLSEEAKIVQDADRLDALGAVGIARAFAYGGKSGRNMLDTPKHFYDKLFKLPELMNTEAGRAIAKERVKYMRDFLIRFDSECNKLE